MRNTNFSKHLFFLIITLTTSCAPQGRNDSVTGTILFVLLSLSFVVGYYAHTRGRNPVGWGILAFFISPIIAAIIIAFLKDLSIDKKLEQIDNKANYLKTEIDFNQKFNDYRADYMTGKVNSIENVVSNSHSIGPKEGHKLIEEKIQCPNCKNQVSPNSTYCSSCGSELMREKVCVNCNETIPAISKFCPHCGQNVENIKCVNCGSKNLNGSKYCKNCGSLLV